MGDFNTTLPTFAAGQPVLASDLATLSSFATAATAAWSTWAPTFTNLTAGNGTTVARYRRLGKTVDYFFRFTLGSTSAVGTNPYITLPYTIASSYTATTTDIISDDGYVYDTSANTWMSAGLLYDGTGTRIVNWSSTGLLAGIAAGSPWAWATGDKLSVWGKYEAA